MASPGGTQVPGDSSVTGILPGPAGSKSHVIALGKQAGDVLITLLHICIHNRLSLSISNLLAMSHATLWLPPPVYTLNNAMYRGGCQYAEICSFIKNQGYTFEAVIDFVVTPPQQ
ncbi:hypothetical protein [Alteromonas gilva]|uniref:Uncharacterized protein n=1 Tax=Alteromonas gilva TaxID=2987522 RepID=A0ABT5KZE6_9ALTE|nr:hypothetical protein [Alteromonas gilva]MDC8829646.1 hypothetical protein [Alteromonas gilva]